jgi:hypothetical protein
MKVLRCCLRKLAPISDAVPDEQAVYTCDTMSTGFVGAEHADIPTRARLPPYGNQRTRGHRACRHSDSSAPSTLWKPKNKGSSSQRPSGDLWMRHANVSIASASRLISALESGPKMQIPILSSQRPSGDLWMRHANVSIASASRLISALESGPKMQIPILSSRSSSRGRIERCRNIIIMIANRR